MQFKPNFFRTFFSNFQLIFMMKFPMIYIQINPEFYRKNFEMYIKLKSKFNFLNNKITFPFFLPTSNLNQVIESAQSFLLERQILNEKKSNNFSLNLPYCSIKKKTNKIFAEIFQKKKINFKAGYISKLIEKFFISNNLFSRLKILNSYESNFKVDIDPESIQLILKILKKQIFNGCSKKKFLFKINNWMVKKTCYNEKILFGKCIDQPISFKKKIHSIDQLEYFFLNFQTIFLSKIVYNNIFINQAKNKKRFDYFFKAVKKHIIFSGYFGNLKSKNFYKVKSSKPNTQRHIPKELQINYLCSFKNFLTKIPFQKIKQNNNFFIKIYDLLISTKKKKIHCLTDEYFFRNRCLLSQINLEVLLIAFNFFYFDFQVIDQKKNFFSLQLHVNFLINNDFFVFKSAKERLIKKILLIKYSEEKILLKIKILNFFWMHINKSSSFLLNLRKDLIFLRLNFSKSIYFIRNWETLNLDKLLLNNFSYQFRCENGLNCTNSKKYGKKISNKMVFLFLELKCLFATEYIIYSKKFSFRKIFNFKNFSKRDALCEKVILQNIPKFSLIYFFFKNQKKFLSFLFFYNTVFKSKRSLLSYSFSIRHIFCNIIKNSSLLIKEKNFCFKLLFFDRPLELILLTIIVKFFPISCLKTFLKSKLLFLSSKTKNSNLNLKIMKKKIKSNFFIPKSIKPKNLKCTYLSYKLSIFGNKRENFNL
jgi:hypothetical protein